MANIAALAITNINPMAFFMFPPKTKIPAVEDAIVMPIVNLLETKDVFTVRAFEDDKREKSNVPFSHCWVQERCFLGPPSRSQGIAALELGNHFRSGIYSSILIHRYLIVRNEGYGEYPLR